MVIWALTPSLIAGPVQAKVAGASALPGSCRSGAVAPGGTAKVTPWNVRTVQAGGTGAGAAEVAGFAADGAALRLGPVSLPPGGTGAAGTLGEASETAAGALDRAVAV